MSRSFYFFLSFSLILIASLNNYAAVAPSESNKTNTYIQTKDSKPSFKNTLKSKKTSKKKKKRLKNKGEAAFNFSLVALILAPLAGLSGNIGVIVFAGLLVGLSFILSLISLSIISSNKEVQLSKKEKRRIAFAFLFSILAGTLLFLGSAFILGGGFP